MKALIIGAAGFVGNYLIDHIMGTMRCEVMATKLPHERMTREDIEIRDLDVLDFDSIVSLLRAARPAYIFHLAAQSSVAFAWKNPGLTTEINVKGSLNLINAIRTLESRPRTLMVGSGEEYGYIRQDQLPLKEDTSLRPGNIYAVTKACQNMVSTVYSRAYQMPLIMVRAFNHIGPGQSPSFVVSDLCKQVAEIELGIREPVILVGNLAAKRDFTDVRDVVNAYTRIVQLGTDGETYNVGRGKAVAISEILDIILSLSTNAISIRVDPQKLRPVDVPIIEPDTGKVYRATGWKPEISLQQSIADILAYWRANLREERGEGL